MNQLKSGGLDEETARTRAEDFVRADGSVPYFGNAGQKKWGGNTMSDALGRVVQDYFRNGKGKDDALAEARKKGATESPVAAPAPAASATSGVTRSGANVIVNITLENRNYTIPTDESGRNDLEGLFKQIGYAAKVAQ